MMDRRRFAVVTAGAMVLPSLRAQTSRDIVIGQSAQLTGPFRAYCLEMLAGVALVFEQANREGGVQGRRLRLVSLDDAYDCARRPNFDHPCRLNIDQGWKPVSFEASCG